MPSSFRRAVTADVVGFDITGDVNIVQKWDVTFDFSQDFNNQLNEYTLALDYANDYNLTLPEQFSYDRTFNCWAWIEKNADRTPNGNLGAQFTDPTERTVPFSPITGDKCNDSNPDGSAFADYAIMITNQRRG